MGALPRSNELELGQTEINHLVLAVVCYGIAILLFRCNLVKAGNPEFEARIHLVKRFLQTFPEQKNLLFDCIESLLAMNG